MTRKIIEEAMNRKPFHPFSIRLTDGELVPIVEEHWAALHPVAQTMIIFNSEGGYRIVDIPLITELQAA